MATRLTIGIYKSIHRYHSHVLNVIIYKWHFLGKYGPVAYALFIGGFFLLDTRLHRDLYYIFIPLIIIYIIQSLQFKQLVKTALFVLVTVWLAYLCLSGLWAEHMDPLLVAESMRRSILILLFLAWTASLKATRQDFFNWLLWPMVIAASIGCLIALFNHFHGGFSFSERLVFAGQNSDVIHGATLYGVAGIVVFIGMLSVNVHWHRVVCGVAFLLIIVSVYMTRSRGEIVALILSIYIAAALSRRRGILLVLALVIPGTILILLTVDAGILEMVVRADSYRLEIWRNAVEIIERRPIFGYGIGHGQRFGQFNGDIMIDPHNIFLANHVYGGVPASVMLIGVYAMVALAGLREAKTDRSPLIGALVLFSMLTGLFHYGNLIINASSIWMFFWLPVSLAVATQMVMRNSQGAEGMLLTERSWVELSRNWLKGRTSGGQRR